MQHGVSHAGCCTQLMCSEVISVCASMMLLLLMMMMMMMASKVMAVMKCKLLTVHYTLIAVLQYLVHILRLFSCMQTFMFYKIGKSLHLLPAVNATMVIVSVKSVHVCTV